MKFSELIKSSLATLRMNGRRTFLTMFGIIIGIASVITILSLGNGFQADTMDALSKDSQGRTSQDFMFIPNDQEESNRRHDPFPKDLLQGVEEIQGVDEAEVKIPEWSQTIYPSIQYLDQNFSEELIYKEETQDQVLVGRNLNAMDSQGARRNITINQELASKIFGEPEDALEQVLSINGENYIVVGVYQALSPQEQLSGANMDIDFSPDFSSGRIPLGTYERYFEDQDSQNAFLRIYYQMDVENMKQVNNEVNDYLNEAGLDKDYGQYTFQDMSEIMSEIGDVLSTVTLFVSSVAAISLFIAGVGVMNMMYISVAERTKEIGIRRSIGASKQSIQWQFLLEGIAITTFGGAIGYGLGVGLAYLIAIFLPFPAKLDVATALGAVAISVLIGIIFSVFPARSASKKNVVEILR